MVVGRSLTGLQPVNLGPGIRAYFTFADFDLSQAEGRSALAGRLGLPLAFAHQVHGIELAWLAEQPAAVPLDRPDRDEQRQASFSRSAQPIGAEQGTSSDLDLVTYPACDGLVTGLVGIGLVIRTADCVPLLLADPAERLVAAVHVGWRGLLAGMVGASLSELRRRGARHLRAAVGPAICGRCYEVGADLAAEARDQGHVTDLRADGSARLDVAASVVRQLRSGGVEAIWLVPECTAESDRLFSWRADRASGRQGAVIALE